MKQNIIVNITAHEIRVASLEDDVLQEVHIERSSHRSRIGDIYKGRCSRSLAGIQAVFVDIGLDRAGFLHISDTQGALPVVGQEILVQVYKDPLGGKGPRLTTQCSLPSAYLVLTPTQSSAAVSQKIVDPIEQQRLLALSLPGNPTGYIFRTAAEGMPEEDIAAAKCTLDALWDEIKIRALMAKPKETVYEEIPFLHRIIRDFITSRQCTIIVDQQEVMQHMQDYAERCRGSFQPVIEYYSGDLPLFTAYKIESELAKALNPRVDLPSGGHLIFDQTEAMTTIDVNTGSSVGKDSTQTLLNTNKEAASAIARHIRLRNLGGIIIIDFIDMPDPNQRENLLQSFEKLLLKDSARTEISEVSRLGLVQMTRKRTRESLERILCIPCPTCRRRGFVKSKETIYYEMARELQRIAALVPWRGFLVIATPDVINGLSEEQEMVKEWEESWGRTIQLKADASYLWEQYDILPTE